MRFVSVEWSLGRDPEVMVEVFSTESVIEAVLQALLEDPEAMAKAMGMGMALGQVVGMTYLCSG